MALLTARQLKARETPEFLVDLGDGGEVLVRVPDVQLLILKNLIPLPLLGEVIKLVGAWTGKVEELTEDLKDKSDDLLLFVDTYICAAVIAPRVVMQRHADDDAMLASDLTLETKKKIMRAIDQHIAAATQEVVADATAFHQDRSSEGTGSDVQEVQPAAI